MTRPVPGWIISREAARHFGGGSKDAESEACTAILALIPDTSGIDRPASTWPEDKVFVKHIVKHNNASDVTAELIQILRSILDLNTRRILGLRPGRWDGLEQCSFAE
jgi:hypothetical protein